MGKWRGWEGRGGLSAIPLWVLLGFFLALSVAEAGARAAPEERVRGQLLFLPVYSELPYGDRGAILKFRVLVDIRNLSRQANISLKQVDYVDDQGRRVRECLKSARTLGPLASERLEVLESDRSGGRSSGFMIEWRSAEPVLPPVIQAVMIFGAYNQGVGLLSEPKVLESWP